MEQDKRLSIKEWPEDERPREKVLRNGVASLSKSELLAILIGSGNADESAVELMKKVLASCNDSIAELSKLSVDDLCLFKGIGPAKAITIIAACELWKRRKADDGEEAVIIRSSRTVYDYFYPLMCDLTTEECHAMLLNNANKVIDCVKVGSGGYTMCDARSAAEACYGNDTLPQPPFGQSQTECRGRSADEKYIVGMLGDEHPLPRPHYIHRR